MSLRQQRELNELREELRLLKERVDKLHVFPTSYVAASPPWEGEKQRKKRQKAKAECGHIAEPRT